eukprot:maker-scaffold147_size311475-snap-gene-2.15 protein:Tk08612 transcript:maker-scaffold147_size311475-snap-gene-2.15-mRNA-1 annotation:"innexin inx2"
MGCLRMYSTFADFSVYFQSKRSFIDNGTFRLHYRVTVALLMCCSMLVTLGQFFGSPMACIVDGDVPGGVMDTYCWIHGTFTIPSQLTKKIGQEVPHPGVAPMQNIHTNETGHIKWTKEGDEIRHAWYQWVCFILFFQGILCYFPHYAWKASEGGKLGMLIQGLDGPMLGGTESAEDKRRAVVGYYIFLMDVFFNGQFTSYGADVLSVSEQPFDQRDDPMNRVFPKVTKCLFHKFGTSGTIETRDGLCVLAMNIINEKIYVFLWFWFIFVSVWTTIHLMFRMISMASRRSRFMLLCNRARGMNRSDIGTVLEKANYGDWFILMQLSKYVNANVFQELLLDLRDRIDQKRAANLSDS